MVECVKGGPAQVSALSVGTAVPQTTVTVGAAIVTTATTQTTPYGFATQAQGDAIVARLNEIRAALVANGILV